MFRTSLARSARFTTISRPFTTSLRLNKGPVEAVKDAAKKVDRTVSDAAVVGIEKGGMLFISPTAVVDPHML
jgi:hypothetical protein